jgi:hypothetical protein
MTASALFSAAASIPAAALRSASLAASTLAFLLSYISLSTSDSRSRRFYLSTSLVRASSL